MDDKLEQSAEEMARRTEGEQATDALASDQVAGAGGSASSAGEGPGAAGSTSTTGRGTGEQSTDEIASELNRLADAFARAARTAWNSEQRRQLEGDLQRGLRRLVDNVEEALKRFSKSEQGQDLREEAERAVERVRSSKVTDDMREGLVKGLRAAATEMQTFADRMQERESAGAANVSTEAQDIPVETTDDAQDIPVDTTDTGGTSSESGTGIPPRPPV